MIGDAQQPVNCDFQASLLASLAHCACFERFQIIQFAADNAPASSLGRPSTKSEKHLPSSINQEDAHPTLGQRIS